MDKIFSFSLAEAVAYAAAFVTLCGAFKYISQGVQRLKQPNKEQNERMDKIEERLDKHDELLNKDLQRIASMEKENHLVMESLFALLQHGIDGNNIEPMKVTQKKIQDYLINK